MALNRSSTETCIKLDLALQRLWQIDKCESPVYVMMIRKSTVYKAKNMQFYKTSANCYIASMREYKKLFHMRIAS